MDILLLTTPAQHQSINPAVELNPKHLQKWITSLPTGDVIPTVKQLHRAISAFNEMPLDTAERFKLLEIYNDAFENIVRNYDDMRIRQLRISVNQRASLAEDIMWLYLELSQGYKIIVKEYYDNGTNLVGDSILSASVFRAMELISLGLLYAFRLRATTPPLAFLEISQLYSLAEQLGMIDKRIRIAKGYAKAPCIADLYKLILLISVADPYKLDPLKIEPLYYALQPFAHFSVVSAASSSENSQFTYAIRMMEDSMPHNVEKIDARDSTRYFNIYPALKEVQGWIAKHDKTDVKFVYEQELILLKEFLQLFFPATGIDLPNQIKLVIGISDCHKLLSTEDNEVVKVFRDSLPVWLVSEKHGHSYTIKGRTTTKQRPLDGELVTLLPSDKDLDTIRMVIAIVRNVTDLEDEYILQVDCLSQHAVPITYSVSGDSDNTPEMHLGVYIPKELKTTPHATLLVAKRLYQSQQMFAISASNHFYTVKAKEMVQETPFYTIFRFNVINNDKKAS